MKEKLKFEVGNIGSNKFYIYADGEDSDNDDCGYYLHKNGDVKSWCGSENFYDTIDEAETAIRGYEGVFLTVKLKNSHA